MDKNYEINFNYGNNVGFTTQFYHEQRDIMDDVSWRALYMNEPIEREGLLYAEYGADMIAERTSEGKAEKSATDPNYKEGRKTLEVPEFEKYLAKTKRVK